MENHAGKPAPNRHPTKKTGTANYPTHENPAKHRKEPEKHPETTPTNP